MKELAFHKDRGYINNSSLVLLAFASAYFPRVIQALGFPPFINFVHFATIPLVCIYVLSSVRFKNRSQIDIVKGLLFGLAALLGVITTSALVNDAGLINVVLQFFLLAEPFIFLLAIVSIPMSVESLGKFRFWWMQFGLANLLFALIQGFVLNLNYSNPDNIKGIFIGQGSGHVVSGTVSMTFALYYSVTARDKPIWVRASVIFAALIHVVIGDVKQALLVFLVALLVFILFKLNNIRLLLQYLAATVVFIVVIVILANTVARSLLTWADLDIQRQGLELKSVGFSIIPTYYHSPLNWLFGLGPGHTIGRLGGWMIQEYQDLLQPLGVTKSKATWDVWLATNRSWLGDRSSFFSPLFGWAGIWGDGGLLGLAVYIHLWVFTWQKIGLDSISRYLIITVLCYGMILSQIEEPGYMMFVTGLIGLRWQEIYQCHLVRDKGNYEIF